MELGLTSDGGWDGDGGGESVGVVRVLGEKTPQTAGLLPLGYAQCIRGWGVGRSFGWGLGEGVKIRGSMGGWVGGWAGARHNRIMGFVFEK